MELDLVGPLRRMYERKSSTGSFSSSSRFDLRVTLLGDGNALKEEEEDRLVKEEEEDRFGLLLELFDLHF